MAKNWFLTYLGRAVVKSRVREMCDLMELDDIEKRLLLERFCGRKNMGQCDFLSEDQQKKLVPSLDCRVQGWSAKNASFFTRGELRALIAHLGEPDPGE